ncbi:hypothetical protein CHS0354_014897, partial [Potamilus streckersoni]
MGMEDNPVNDTRAYCTATDGTELIKSSNTFNDYDDHNDVQKRHDDTNILTHSS